MKLKQQPDDFQVVECTDVIPGDAGPFAFYQMEKSGWTTPDALAAVRRRWKIDLSRLSYGGLKDRHARTVQYFTIHHGPRRDLEHHDIQVKFLGMVPQPYTSADIRCNQFIITLRKVPVDRRRSLDALIPSLAQQGVPNYFDDQRFGSVAGPDTPFIARHLVRGEFEEALKQALAAPYAFDRAEQKKEKGILQQHWGDWQTCKEQLPRSHARSLVDYLRVHPNDFKGAVARLRPELRGLYLSAYQSHLWNRILARWLILNARPEQLQLVRLRLGNVPFHANLDQEVFVRLRELMIPLPSARWKPAAEDPLLPLVEEVVAEEGFALKEMQIRGVRELFFSRGDRSALVLPQEFTHSWAEDERYAGFLRLTLAFTLTRGAYATLIVKRVSEGPLL